jgi:1-phosphofructokinase
MILTLTPNPSLDRAYEVDRLHRGAVLRARSSRVDPGGKGVNVARALAANGHKVVAVLPAGGAEGRQLLELLEEHGVEVVPVPVSQPVRTNISLVEPDGTVTKVNAPGPRLTPEEVQELMRAAEEASRDAEWVVCSGALSPGMPDDLYATLVARLRAAGRRVALDSSGPPLRIGLNAGPDLVKPNVDELEEAVGRPLPTLGDVRAAAEELRATGVGAVLVSLAEDGALLVSEDGAVHGEAPVQVLRGAVGAGDALLAGFLAAGGGLAEGLAWAAAACALPGSQMPGPEHLDRARVRLHDAVEAARPVGGGRR